MRTLKAQGRYLAWDDGTPFFYLGDTAWELFHRLNREEMDHYFAERAAAGLHGRAGGGARGVRGGDRAQRLRPAAAALCRRPARPDEPDLDAGYSYWDHVDYAVEAAAQRGGSSS